MSRSAEGEAMVLVEGLRKRFGKTDALQGLDLAVAPGSVCGLLGPNGAGKTTVIRILATLIKPDGGSARVAGYDVVREADQVRYRIGLAGQYAAVDEKLSGRDNLRLFGLLYHLSGREATRRAEELLERFGLADAGDRKVETYSGGMRRRLDLITSLIVAPPVLFLDEADHLADQIAVIDKGRLIASGPPQELKADIGDRIDVTIRDASHLETASAALSSVTGSEPRLAAERRELSAPVDRGAPLLAEVVRAFDRAGVQIENMTLRQPTLDEVFLRLVGRSPEPAEATAGAKERA